MSTPILYKDQARQKLFEEIAPVIKKYVSSKSAELAELRPQTNFYQLGLDSMHIVELMLGVEEIYERTGPEGFEEIATIDDLVTYASKIKEEGKQAASK